MARLCFLVGKVYVSMVGYVVWVKYVFIVGCVALGGMCPWLGELLWTEILP